MFVIRWALDDSVDNSLAAAVDALHALIVSTDDEVWINNYIIINIININAVYRSNWTPIPMDRASAVAVIGRHVARLLVCGLGAQ